jgi:uncharacterized protein YjbJ (UPF0337 family)
MNRHHIEHNWKQFKGRIKDHQGSSTGDQFEMICGKCEPLVGSIQESYGISEDEAERLLEHSIWK